MKKLLLGLITSILLSQSVFAKQVRLSVPHLAPQPTACVGAAFSATNDNKGGKSIVLALTNHCGKTVDFQNAAVTFQNRSALNTSFCGYFRPLSYPDNKLEITSLAQSNGNFLATLNLHFPTFPGANSQLPPDSSILIYYSASSADYIEGTTHVYLENPVDLGQIELTNTSARPMNVDQDYALVHISANGQAVSEVQLPWHGTQAVTGLAAQTYTVSADTVADTQGNSYQGAATPSSVTVTPNQTAKVSIAYTQVNPIAKIGIHLQALPSELQDYPCKPTALLTDTNMGSSVLTMLDWNTTTIISQLKNGSTYRFATPDISYHGFQCTPTFAPATLVASETAPVTNLSYQCVQVGQVQGTLHVNGAPSTLASLKVTLTPNNNTSEVTQTVSLSNGSGSQTVMLTNGVIYNVSAEPVQDYAISFNPQPLTASANVSETITLKPIDATGTPVSLNGQLSVCGTHLCNEHGQPIQLKGMSSHGLQWYGLNKCLTQASIDALAHDFKANVMRISLYVQEGGYETDPAGFTNQVNQLITEATKRGIYAIIDWHQLTPGDPNFNLERAKKFFTDIATANKGKNNLIYEIANEPNGVSWSTIKNYADELIPVIRAIDPKTTILVGTPGWSSLGISDGRNSQDIINNPVNFPNIMYTFHFYAASHKDVYINELDKASDVLPIFVSEWGTQTFTGDGGNDFVMSARYTKLMQDKKISWTNWNYSDDFRSGAVWQVGTCSEGPWTDARLKPAGLWIKDQIKN